MLFLEWKISLMFIPNGPIHNMPVLVQMMAWRRPGDKPLSVPMVVGLLAHICVTRPQWVNGAEEIGLVHYSDVTMSVFASQINSRSTICSTVCSDAHQRKHQISMLLAGVWRIPLTKVQLRGNCFHLMTSSWTPTVALGRWNEESIYIFMSG